MISLEDIDRYADYAETGLATASLGLTGVSLASANPVIGGLAACSNLLGAGIDIYQGIRSGFKGDWTGVGKNILDLGLSLVGAKALKSAKKKMYKLDKILDARRVPRQTITKTVGRGKGRHKITITKERNKANNYAALSTGSNLGNAISSIVPNLNGTIATNISNYTNKHNFNTNTATIYSANTSPFDTIVNEAKKKEYITIDSMINKPKNINNYTIISHR